jgi:hypothetical protein
MMSNPEELAMVVKAIKSGLGGCVEWHEREVDRIEVEMLRHGLTLPVIRKSLVQHVRNGGEVFQVKEERERRKDRRDYYYKTFVPMPDLFPKGLFVEMEIVNTDPEFPEIRILNAHEQQ